MEHSSTNGKIPVRIKTRRDFLTYMLGTTVASVAIGYLFPKVSQSREIDRRNPMLRFIERIHAVKIIFQDRWHWLKTASKLKLMHY
ncbi:hypothetical protein [Nostoc sp.]|uniref:hypothetical protein n=1 Tax=Nostoc sp. TaxID=1180 RepID=UPI002FFBB1D6